MNQIHVTTFRLVVVVLSPAMPGSQWLRVYKAPVQASRHLSEAECRSLLPRTNEGPSSRRLTDHTPPSRFGGSHH